MNHFVKQLILFAILLLTIQTAHGALIIDTEPASLAEEAWVLTNEQFLAAEFVLGRSYKITDVQGWIGTQTVPGWIGSKTNVNLRYTIRKDDSTSGEIPPGQIPGEVPGSIIYSQTLELAVEEDAGWRGPSVLNWNLSAGTYWLSFEADVYTSEGFYWCMPFPANIPLSNYAFSDNTAGNPVWYEYDELNLGVRIYGEQQGANIPEPATLLLLGLGLIALAGSRRFNN